MITALHKYTNEIDLGMAATGETDGGIGWKVEMGLDSNVTDATDQVQLMVVLCHFQVTLVQSVLVMFLLQVHLLVFLM